MLTSFATLTFVSRFPIAAAQSATALATDGPPHSEAPSDAGPYIFWYLVLPLLTLSLYLIVRRSGALKQGLYLQRAEKHMEFVEEHVRTVERQNARMIELLELSTRSREESKTISDPPEN